MSALPPPPPLAELETTDQFLVGYGKSGAVGVFASLDGVPLRRGTTVVIQTARGLERGSVLGPATLRQARLLGAVSSGSIVRRASAEDERQQAAVTRRGHVIFEAARARLAAAQLDIDLLDVDLLFDARLAVLQYVGGASDLDDFAAALQAEFSVEVRLENLTLPAEKRGCDKPDCGRDAGGCSSCSSGGGCSSCGSAKVDMRDYFGHLRTQMEQRRTPLL
jgi:cell fate regulator YaaT (PSP1 superfamily)